MFGVRESKHHAWKQEPQTQLALRYTSEMSHHLSHNCGVPSAELLRAGELVPLLAAAFHPSTRKGA